MTGLSNSERADLLAKVVSTLSGWKSKRVRVVESISRRSSPSGHDRHFSTRSTFTFVIERAFWAISGGRLIVLGADTDFGYEVGFDLVESATIEAHLVSLVERLEQQTERVSTISLNDE